MTEEDILVIERVGGVAGFGTPGSHLKSKGMIPVSELDPADRSLLDDLFAGRIPAGRATPDAFRYRITRKLGNRTKTIEAAEEKVPLAIRDCVRDILE